MAQSFFDAFNQALPQGMALGQRQQQIQMQQEAQQKEIGMRMWQELAGIMKLPAGNVRSAFLKMGAEQYKQLTGSDFPQPIFELLQKANDDELAEFKEIAGAYADAGIPMPVVLNAMQRSPGSLPNLISSWGQLKQVQLDAAESSRINAILSGGGQPMEMGQPMGGGGMGDLGPVTPGAQRMPAVSVTATRMGDDLDSQIDMLKGQMKQLMGMKSTQAKALRDDLRQQISQLMAEKRAIASEERADRREARADARASAADARSERNSILNPEVFNRQMQLARARAETTAQVQQEYRPLPASQAAELGDLDAIGAQIDRIQGSYSPSFVGPVAGRAGGIRETFGNVTERETAFRAEAAALQNVILKARSGGAVTPQEADRLLKEIPTVNLPANAFEQRLRSTKQRFEEIARAKRQSFKGAGYGRVPQGQQPRLNKAPADLTDEEVMQYLNQEGR